MEMKNNLFIEKLISCGIPTIDVSSFNFDTKHKARVQGFIVGKDNLVICGDKSYEYSIRLLRMKIAFNMDNKIYFNTHSSVVMNRMEGYDFDVISIANIFGDIKFNICGIIDYFISRRIQLLLASIDVDNISSALKNCWSTVDNNFQVLKL